MVRRTLAICDAYIGATDKGPNWKMAAFYDGSGHDGDMCSSSFKSWAAKNAREDNDTNAMRNRAAGVALPTGTADGYSGMAAVQAGGKNPSRG